MSHQFTFLTNHLCHFYIRDESWQRCSALWTESAWKTTGLHIESNFSNRQIHGASGQKWCMISVWHGWAVYPMTTKSLHHRGPSSTKINHNRRNRVCRKSSSNDNMKNEETVRGHVNCFQYSSILALLFIRWQYWADYICGVNLTWPLPEFNIVRHSMWQWAKDKPESSQLFLAKLMAHTLLRVIQVIVSSTIFVCSSDPTNDNSYGP